MNYLYLFGIIVIYILYQQYNRPSVSNYYHHSIIANIWDNHNIDNVHNSLIFKHHNGSEFTIAYLNHMNLDHFSRLQDFEYFEDTEIQFLYHTQQTRDNKLIKIIPYLNNYRNINKFYLYAKLIKSKFT